ncbi:hypothetical protein BC829DRAFT_80266 [Chytridium lagenaria]|nr:hypothetical protein BC829DRAFT_80266 [Chytridium lagenaria]
MLPLNSSLPSQQLLSPRAVLTRPDAPPAVSLKALPATTSPLPNSMRFLLDLPSGFQLSAFESANDIAKAFIASKVGGSLETLGSLARSPTTMVSLT